MRKLIVGSQAQQAGLVTEYELRRGYVRMHRNIYVPKGYSPDLVDVIDGAWLRSGRNGVVAGIAASALHGASWVSPDTPVELIWNNTRPPAGIIARAEHLVPDEITTLDCIAVTTAARTAGCLRVRRRSASDRPGAIRQRPTVDAQGGAAGLGGRPGDQGRSGSGHPRPHVYRSGPSRRNRRWRPPAMLGHAASL